MDVPHKALLTLSALGFLIVVLMTDAPARTLRICIDCEPSVPPVVPRIVVDPMAPGYVRGDLIVQVKPGVDLAAPPPSLNALNARWGFIGYVPAFPVEQSTPAALANMRARFANRSLRASDNAPLPRLDLVFNLYLNPQSDIERAAKEYAADPNISYAHPNWVMVADFAPNDEFYVASQLWGLTKIQMESAWNMATGNGVTIAIVDSYVDPTHPDLSPHTWTNPLEIQDGLDNDQNGFVDDIHGWNWESNMSGGTDGCGHGTHVAGIAAAVANNGAGVAGVAFDARIMPVGVISKACTGTAWLSAKGVLYAVSQGADVINVSLSFEGVAETMDAAIEVAHKSGVLVIAAAGNKVGEAYRFTPGNVERAMTIAATTPLDLKADFSNYGVKVDVGAPGVGILSTMSDNSFLLLGNVTPITGSDGRTYLSLPGTSMSAPHVSGLAALLIQQHPLWRVEEIRQAIRRTAVDVSLPGIDNLTGHGRIDAAAATTLGPIAPPTANVTIPRNGGVIRGDQLAAPVTIEGYADVDPSLSLASYTLQIGTGQMPTSWTTLNTSGTAVSSGVLGSFDATPYVDGEYVVRVLVTDSNGLTSEDRNLVIVDTVQITDPVKDQVVNGTYEVHGLARSGPGFSGYTLSWKVGCQPIAAYTQFASGATPVGDDGLPGVLASWNTSALPEGRIGLKLDVTYGSSVSTDEVCLVLDKLEAPHWPVAINHRPGFKSPKAANLDGIGDKEVIVGASVWNSDGTLHTGWTDFPGLGRTNPAIVNLDGGLDLEVVAAEFQSYDYDEKYPNNGGAIVSAYKSDKSLLWTYPVASPGGTPGHNNGIPSSIAVGDVDGDGALEVVFSVFFREHQPDPEGRTWIFVLNATSGAYEGSFSVSGESIGSLALADLNRDHTDDIVVSTYLTASKLGRIYALTGAGQNLPGWPFTNGAASGPLFNQEEFAQADPIVVDFDRHGRYKILALWTLLDANGNLLPNWPFTSGAASAGAAVAFDNDCPLEAVLGGAAKFVYHAAKVSTAASLKQLVATPVTQQIQMEDENNQPGNTVVADLNGDAKPEIIKPGNAGALNALLPLYGSGRSVATEQVGAFFGVMPIFDKIRSTPTVTDIDNDRKTDLLLVADGKVHWWRLGTTYLPLADGWPEYQHDLRNTGTLLTRDYTNCSAPQLPAGN